MKKCGNCKRLRTELERYKKALAETAARATSLKMAELDLKREILDLRRTENLGGER